MARMILDHHAKPGNARPAGIADGRRPAAVESQLQTTSWMPANRLNIFRR